jgi:hypothetical protein
MGMLAEQGEVHGRLAVLAVALALLGIAGCGGSQPQSHNAKAGSGGSWAVVESLLAEKTGWNRQAAKKARRLAEDEGVTAAEGERCYLGSQLPGEWPHGCAVFARIERELGARARAERPLSEEAAHSKQQSAARKHHREAEEIAERERQEKARRRAAHQVPAGAAALTVKLYREWTGIERQQFQLAYETCGSQPQSQSAEEWETSDDPSSIAHAFGLEYREPVRAAIEEGCLRAFTDSHAQWEAELEAFGQL